MKKSVENGRHRGALRVLAAGLLVLCGAAGGSASAQEAPAVPAGNVVNKLIGLMVQRGLLTEADAVALRAQAESEAARAVQAAQAAPAGKPGDVHVRYMPQTVRDEMAAQLKREVIAQAQAENWAQPNAIPEWTRRIRPEGDVRVRNESRFFRDYNSNVGVDWAGINNGAGFDVNPNTNLALPPLTNTRRDRDNVYKLRARIGMVADVNEHTAIGVRLASGNDNNPVSTTQTLGGGLAKKSIWLDQAWLSYRALPDVVLTGGRFANPFWSSDTLFSSDLNVDGVAAAFEHKLAARPVSVFGTLGFIPLEYSADNAPSRSDNKAASHNKFLLGAQAGASWKLDSRNTLRGALAYYDFKHVSGQLSDPCALYAGVDGCSTDWSRPAFMQKGNTLMLLRNISLNPLNPQATPQPQYVGLASKFRLADVNLRWDGRFDGAPAMRLDGNYVRNLAYDEDEMFRRANGGIVNNFGATVSGVNDRSNFRSGGSAYMLQATLGTPAVSKRGQWNLLAGYKRIEPDALPDGYNDPNFHLGGTNARGYYLGGSLALDQNTWFTARWMAAKEVVGPPLTIDLLQVELNARF